MHDYLQVFKNPGLISYLFELRKTHGIDPELGTMSKSHIFSSVNALKISDKLSASIQLYEYLFYDFIANEKIYSILDPKSQQSLNNAFKAIKSGILVQQKNGEMKLPIWSLDAEVTNYVIGCLVDHSKYCELFARMATPDYLQVFRDIDVCGHLTYVKIQSGLHARPLMDKPEVFEGLAPEMASSFQLLEYIYYDFLTNQEFHNSLTPYEQHSARQLLWYMYQTHGMARLDNIPPLEHDIKTVNKSISTRIDNKKFFELYNSSTLCPREEKMNINNICHNEINIGMERHKEYIRTQFKVG